VSIADKRAVRSSQNHAQGALQGLSLESHEVQNSRVRSNNSYLSLEIPSTDHEDSIVRHGRFTDAKSPDASQDILKAMKQSPHTTRTVEIFKPSAIRTIHEQQPAQVTEPRITKDMHAQALQDLQIKHERKLQTLKSKIEAERSRADEAVKQTLQANSNRDKIIRELNTAIVQRDSALKKAETASKNAENAAKKNTTPTDQTTQLQNDLKAARKMLEASDKRNATLDNRMQTVRDNEAERLLNQEEHWQHKTTSIEKELEEIKEQNDQLAAFKNSQSDRVKAWKEEREVLMKEIGDLREIVKEDDEAALKSQLNIAQKEARDARFMKKWEKKNRKLE